MSTKAKIDSPTRQVETGTYTPRPMSNQAPNNQKIDSPVPQIDTGTPPTKPMTTQAQLEQEWADLQAEFKRLQPEANCSISRRNGIEVAREIVRELKEKIDSPTRQIETGTHTTKPMTTINDLPEDVIRHEIMGYLKPVYTVVEIEYIEVVTETTPEENDPINTNTYQKKKLFKVHRYRVCLKRSVQNRTINLIWP